MVWVLFNNNRQKWIFIEIIRIKSQILFNMKVLVSDNLVFNGGVVYSSWIRLLTCEIVEYNLKMLHTQWCSVGSTYVDCIRI